MPGVHTGEQRARGERDAPQFADRVGVLAHDLEPVRVVGVQKIVRLLPITAAERADADDAVGETNEFNNTASRATNATMAPVKWP